MKIKNIITVLLLTVAIHALGQSTDGMQRMPNGIQYKIFTPNAGPKIKLNDIITFNFLQKTDKDSILVNSFEVNSPATLQVTQSRNVADLMDFFPMLSLNDSAWVTIPTDSIFNNPQMQRPPFLPAGSSIRMVIKILKIQSMEEAMAEQQKKMDEMKKIESTALAKYFSENKAPTIKTVSGLHYRITKPSVKLKPVKGDTVLVNYIGRTLAGKVFDTSIGEEAKKAGLQQGDRVYEPISVIVGQGGVIPGWEEGLLLINEGAKATFIIPSELAYGPRGASEDIGPFTPLSFDIELVKVKRQKKVVAPLKKPAAKPVTKKPAVKPTAKKPAVKTTATKKK